MVVAGAPNKSTFHAHHITDMVSMELHCINGATLTILKIIPPGITSKSELVKQ